jgi:hypothetical protein
MVVRKQKLKVHIVTNCAGVCGKSQFNFAAGGAGALHEIDGIMRQ